MKSILVADNRADLLATLEPILKHWGYRVLSTRRADQVVTFLKTSAPCLLIIGEEMLADPRLDIGSMIQAGELPVIALRQKSAKPVDFVADETLDVPVELFGLFSFIQRKVENHPRQNLRLRVQLPGMYSIDDKAFILAELLSLSTQGLFFKAATRVNRGDCITVVFPLFGHCKEIEVKAKVLYAIQPEAANNFFQGFGVAFDDVPDDHKGLLRHFIREHFLKEVSSRRDGVGGFAAEQIKK